MRVAEGNQLSRKLQKLILLFVASPIEPTDLIVLAISVVVAHLRSAPLIATTEHRNALRKKKGRQEISPLPFTQGVDLRIIGWTFNAAIPREIVIVAVAVAVAVQFIVLFVVTDQIVQGETIMCGHEIDTRVRASPVVLIKVGAPGKSIPHLANAPLIAFPKTANRVAIFAVPFRPRRRKIPNLIAAIAYVPRFRD